MPSYDPQRSRSRPRAADDDAPAPVDEILGTDAPGDTPERPVAEPTAPEPSSPEPMPAEDEPVLIERDAAGPVPSSPRVPIAEPIRTPAGLPREAFIGFAAAVLVIVALVLRRRRRKRRGPSGD
jgi:hypothetical protein